MAVKDHSLDEKLVKAAWGEFMEHGFQKASLHKIAEQAGITTGAIYTRYKNKDDLFCQLVSGAFSRVSVHFEPMRQKYHAAQKSGRAEDILEVIREEEKIYLDFMFRYYDECVLFFCRSDGSSVELMLRSMMETKAKETASFLQQISKREVDPDGIELIMTEQFHFYRNILQKGYSREKAVSCMKTVELFLEAGWKALLEHITEEN